MKHGKAPTVAQKTIISAYKFKAKNLNPDNWLVVKNLPNELVIRNRKSTSVIQIPIERRRGK